MPTPDRNRAELIFLKWRLAPLLWEGSVTDATWFRDDIAWTDRALETLRSHGFAFDEGRVVHGHVMRLEFGNWAHVCGAVNRPLALARAVASFAADATQRCLLPFGQRAEEFAGKSAGAEA
jgi:hypothetical protein